MDLGLKSPEGWARKFRQLILILQGEIAGEKIKETMDITLKKTTIEDLETLFDYQTDERSNWLAAFTPENPHDKPAYMAKWTRIVSNPEIDMQTIWFENQLAGSVIHFTIDGETNVSYWLGRDFWGRGIATEALKRFLGTADKKIFHARVAFDNFGSQRVLEKCGFKVIGKEVNYAAGRKTEVEEFICVFEK